MRLDGPLWLASRSPRRRQLLESARLNFRVRRPEIDDGRLRCDRVPPEHWVVGMALLKAANVADLLARREPGATGIVLGADTVCVHRGRVLGQPTDADHARAMLRELRDADHEVLTGVCLIDLSGGDRSVFFDRAMVRVGHLGDDEIDRYVESGSWRGKAGGYNLAERLEAGWPLRCDGDPATVMGLPMRRLLRWFAVNVPTEQVAPGPNSGGGGEGGS